MRTMRHKKRKEIRDRASQAVLDMLKMSEDEYEEYMATWHVDETQVM